MAIQYEDTVKKELASGNLKGVYLLLGDDAYLKKMYADKLADRAYDGDPFFNLQKFEGDCDLQDVYNAVEQLPMMADRKCVVLTDYDFEHASKENLDRLCLLLSAANEECVRIVRFDSVEFDAKRSTKAKKLIAAAEKSGGHAVRLDHKRPAELAKVITDGAIKRGCRMDPHAAKYLVEIVGSDMNTLKNELDKLCAYKPGEPIEKSVIDLVSIKSIEASVYDLTKEIIACNLSAALEMLDSLFFMRLEPMIILHTVSSSYVDLYRIAIAKKAGLSISQVAAEFGYKGREFVLERASSSLRKFDADRLKLSFDALLLADRGLKSTGSDPRIVLEQLIVRLIYIILKGEAIDQN